MVEQMKNLLFLSGFNNYYDRKIKRFETLEEYLSFEYVIKQNVNFVPADGVQASLTSNISDDFTPDYIVVFNEFDEILSRWYILESTRTLNGQYKVSIRRDLMADFLNNIQDAPVWVSKANLEADDPLIFNKESGEYNQIKQSETSIKDTTKTPWLVGYIAKGYDFTSEGKTYSTVLDRAGTPTLESLGITLQDSDPAAGGVINVFDGPVNFRLGIELTSYSGKLRRTANSFYNVLNNTFIGNSLTTGTNVVNLFYSVPPVGTLEAIRDAWFNKLVEYKSSISLALDTHMTGIGKPIIEKEQYLEILELDGKLVYSTFSDKYYKLIIGTTKNIQKVDKIDQSQDYDVSLKSLLDAAESSIINQLGGIKKEDKYEIAYTLNEITIILVETIGDGTLSVKIPNGHTTLNDAPYDMFAMPYNENNMLLMNKIIESLGVEIIYDAQILPYCPARHLVDENGVNLALGASTDYNPIKLDDETVSHLLWCKKSSDTFIVPLSFSTGLTAEEVKVINETEFLRLSSPNYNGLFDFSVAKNKGVDYFRVSYTYKPFTPYIQVSPNFKGLYGNDFQDARGLICNGNFSIAMISDAWTSYELNNKNFQNIFDTQIQTMDYQHRMSMISGGVGSAINAAGIGLGAGIMAGPVAGIAAGAASAAGGLADLAIGNSVYQNNKQSQKDIFNYNLGNIKARPDTLTKISAYNINNKYFPFIEHFSSTEEEKEVLRNKLKFEGMTVGKIGKISEYIGRREEFNFFKGQLIITNQAISDDYHLVDAIAVELEKGVYL